MAGVPMLLLMMNSRRAVAPRPGSAAGRSRGQVGLPTFIMILNGRSGISPARPRSPAVSSRPSKMKPVSPGAGRSPPVPGLRWHAASHHGRNAQLTGDDGRVAGTPAAVGHDGAGALHHRFPGYRSVMSVTSTSPGLHPNPSRTDVVDEAEPCRCQSSAHGAPPARTPWP